LRHGVKSPWILVILLIIGGLIGTLLGETLGQYWPILKTGFQPIGLQPTTIDLVVFSLTFGLIIQLNVASLVGFLVALFVYFRL